MPNVQPVHRRIAMRRRVQNSVPQKVRCLMIRRLIEAPDVTLVQETTFAIDVQGRYVCNTWDEAIGTIGNGGVALRAGGGGAGAGAAHPAAENFPPRGEGGPPPCPPPGSLLGAQDPPAPTP